MTTFSYLLMCNSALCVLIQLVADGFKYFCHTADYSLCLIEHKPKFAGIDLHI